MCQVDSRADDSEAGYSRTAHGIKNQNETTDSHMTTEDMTYSKLNEEEVNEYYIVLDYLPACIVSIVYHAWIRSVCVCVCVAILTCTSCFDSTCSQL